MASNPLSFGNFDLRDANTVKLFLQQLSVALNQLYQPSFNASVLNGQALLQNSALIYVGFSLLNQTTSQTVECVNASGVVGTFSINTAVNLNLTLAHLAIGVPSTVRLVNSSAGTQTFTMNFTNPAGTSGTVFAFNGGTFVNMTTTGMALTTSQQRLFVGATDGTSMFMINS